MDSKEAIRQFISDNFYVPDADALTGTASLLEGGIVDSTGVLELISFLESRFNINIDDSELTPDNLDTIDSMAAFVARKRTSKV